MAHMLRHFCSLSSIGTDTRCCSNGAGFLFKNTFSRWIPRIAKTVPLFKEGQRGGALLATTEHLCFQRSAVRPATKLQREIEIRQSRYAIHSNWVQGLSNPGKEVFLFFASGNADTHSRRMFSSAGMV